MSVTLHDASLGVVSHYLKTLSHLLDKGAAYAEEKGIDPQSLLDARIAPDMAPLTRQVQFVSDTAKGAAGRLSGQEVPSFPDEEKTFADLQARLAKTLAFVDGVKPDEVNGNEDKEIVLRFGPERSMSFTGKSYALTFVVPNLLFHVATAYDILRANGVPVGKSDYLKLA